MARATTVRALTWVAGSCLVARGSPTFRKWHQGGEQIQVFCAFAHEEQVSPQELKKALVAAGLEVYRTTGDAVVLADRVRDNLIMDSGVCVRETSVTLVLHARRAQYPNDVEEAIFQHIRGLAAAALALGFVEQGTRVTPLRDPSDPTRTLDTFFEVVFTKPTGDLAETLEGAHTALDLAKKADPTG